MRANIHLLDLVVKTIESDLEHWDQLSWRTNTSRRVPVEGNVYELPIECDTSFCFAGWAIQLGSEERPQWASEGTLYVTSEEAKTNDGSLTISASERATNLLGLSGGTASRLFSANNTLPTIKRIVSEIKARR